jgi:MoxR-like ATPase
VPLWHGAPGSSIAYATHAPVSDALTDRLKKSLASVIRGKPRAIELVVIGALTEGHLLIEDVPGVGKTTLAKAFARSLELSFSRVQFTPDLLPTDIVGAQTLGPDGRLVFQKGPIFTQVLLADEINRASPRTQSALLEAMSERQVTVDGHTYSFPGPFIVLATQNPVDFQGTFPLPEAQLDRFTIRLSMGYPEEADELEMLTQEATGNGLAPIQPVGTEAEFAEVRARVQQVHMEKRVLVYLRRLVHETRQNDHVALGVSPRGGITLYRTAQARAFVHGRDYVTPEDIQDLAKPVLAHRMVLTERARYGGVGVDTVIAGLLEEVPVPR